jgi:hypothetical protein
MVTTEALVEMPYNAHEVNARASGLLVRLFGPKPVPTGDRKFDRTYVVHGASARVIEGIFDAEVRTWILARRPALLRVADNEVLFQRDGPPYDPDADSIRIILLGLVRIAERLALVGEARGYR